MERDADLDRLWDEFHSVVNMTSRELRDWVSVEGAGEDAERLPDQSGPETGRQVLDVLSKRKTDLTEGDLAVMRGVIDLVHRERGEDLEGTITDDGTRRRLMDVGHDALRST